MLLNRHIGATRTWQSINQHDTAHRTLLRSSDTRIMSTNDKTVRCRQLRPPVLQKLYINRIVNSFDGRRSCNLFTSSAIRWKLFEASITLDPCPSVCPSRQWIAKKLQHKQRKHPQKAYSFRWWPRKKDAPWSTFVSPKNAQEFPTVAQSTP